MVATFLSYWSGRPICRFDGWSVAATVACLIILGPILALWLTALGDSKGLWGHLVTTVIPRYVVNTLLLMAGVTAWQTQSLKVMYYQVAGDQRSMAVLTNMGALNLYISFLNMFQFLLMFMGQQE